MPIRKVADACSMHLLMAVADAQATNKETDQCGLTPECTEMTIKGSALGFQQTARVTAAQLARAFDCIEQVDMQAYIYKLCMHIYKEAKSLEAWEHPPGTKTLYATNILLRVARLLRIYKASMDEQDRFLAGIPGLLFRRASYIQETHWFHHSFYKGSRKIRKRGMHLTRSPYYYPLISWK